MEQITESESPKTETELRSWDMPIPGGKDQPLISLCLIVGNVEEYIERCLRSFAPVADEICVVRAIGNQLPDETLNLAFRVCRELGIKYAEAFYHNNHEHHDWPHIDDFAAARNLSFSLARGKYIMWADTDDVFGDPGADNSAAVELVRAMAEGASYPIFLLPYRIFGRGLTLNRERLVSRELFEANPKTFWRYPVHECMAGLPDKIEGAIDERVVVTHLPNTNKHGSNERNLRILESIPENEMSSGLLYHLHGEYMYLGRQSEEMKVKSIDCARRALACPDIGKPERYELFLNLGKMSDGHAAEDRDTQAAYFHQAYATDPKRREALGLLVCNALDRGQPFDALAHARHMMITPPPKQSASGQLWNHRQDVYGWLGVDIFTQALRSAGEVGEAEQWRRKVLSDAQKQNKPIISIVHACYGRPKQSSIIRKLWHDLAENPDAIEYIFVIDEGDKDSQVLRRMHHVTVPAGAGCVAAWNAGALAARGDVIISMADDRYPVPRWDTLILERFGDDLREPRVLAVGDGHRKDDLLTMSIVTREYLSQDNFLFHPRFWGVYCDNYFTNVAYARKHVIEARDIVFEHDHPYFNPEKKMDRSYELQNAPERYTEGQKIYDELMNGNDWSSVPGFFNYWWFYQRIAQTIQDGDTIAEIGVWFGRSIIFLAQELKRLGKNNVKILAVDNFTGNSNKTEELATESALRSIPGYYTLRQSFTKNIDRCGVSDMIKILDGPSDMSASGITNESLAFCYIDASHDYESVKRDLEAWLPKVKKGHTIAGHDADHEPVARAVKEKFGKAAAFMGPVWMATPSGCVPDKQPVAVA